MFFSKSNYTDTIFFTVLSVYLFFRTVGPTSLIPHGKLNSKLSTYLKVFTSFIPFGEVSSCRTRFSYL